MKIYISTDMEGIGGVCRPVQVTAGNIEYESARGWMEREILAVIEGAREAGATDFVVKDAQDSRGCARIYGHFGRSMAPWPFVNLYTSLDTQGQPVNLSGFHAIEFWARGDGKQYRFAADNTTVQDSCYYEESFTAPKVWTKVHIEFADMAQPAWGKEVFRDFGSVKRLFFMPKGMTDEDFDLSISEVILVK